MSDMVIPEFTTSVDVDVERWNDAGVSSRRDVVAEEVPVALEYNGISHAVMMATPANLEDFALGFSLTEGILQDRSELFDCEIVEAIDGIQVQMRIATERFVSLKEKRRNLTGRTGCGLCGAETLQQAVRKPAAVVCNVRFSASTIYAGMAAMHKQQQLQQVTGATHAAAWLHADGSISVVREDVGRHNALDKLIGALAQKNPQHDFANGAVLITSRASYEMVQKSATMGIGFIVAVSAPTALAIRLAEQANVTLLGFVRQTGHVAYAHSQRLERAI
ncbi:formate dehydrogenase family accessory protein FdhD [Collimonas arenae]|uniref:Sulfur carrier protein FdhD n=1 Tax=Collimonas arenae TaxID=279058 RepID=A0A127PMZ4_9BURK|nr:formate dehydrogenase accessory sulfurtransferase FdhD [Collimonas arenae]AMO98781.1 formate dehydrogenase family accessory protein FdhD [Collimonas arenae]AMP08674.1 formate dehydrogenase family accessory protein FdhD [Collimonas arenae]